MAKEEVRLTCEGDSQRGRRISRDVVVQLVARGAGYCYRPECTIGFLWHELDDGSAVKLAQVAHVVAASINGPRSDPDAPDEKLTSIHNLILLCPNCHIIVDRAPLAFTVEHLEEWKQAHESRVAEVWGVRKYPDRTELRNEINAALQENLAVWDAYGPDSVAAGSLAPDPPATWRREVLATIIPNNSRVLRILDANKNHLSDDDTRVVAQFRIHARSLVDRHLGGITNTAAPRFPKAMSEILEGARD